MKPTTTRRVAATSSALDRRGHPAPSASDCVLTLFAEAATKWRAKADEWAEAKDFASEAYANNIAGDIDGAMSFLAAASLAGVIIKARAARAYVEPTDGRLPENNIDRLWLSIADDIERLAESARS